MLQLFAVTLFLDSKHFTDIRFYVLLWAGSNLMIFIVVSPSKQIFMQTNICGLEQTGEISNVITCKKFKCELSLAFIWIELCQTLLRTYN